MPPFTLTCRHILSTMVVLWTQGSGVERSGAAQGLAEVLAVLGPAYLDDLLPDILAGCTARSANAREGHLTLFKFLPLAIPDHFQVRLVESQPIQTVALRCPPRCEFCVSQ